MLAERTLAFAAQAPAFRTRKALSNSFLDLIAQLGAKRFACVYLKREAGELAIDRSISNLTRGWQELYIRRGYDASDPVFQSVSRGGAYGFWSEMTRTMSLDKLSKEVMSAARDFDMKDGFTKRVALDGGGTALMMVAGEELVRSERARAALRMASDVFANEGVRMLKQIDESEPADGEPKRLSKMQLKVLLMRADGLSIKAIAAKLDRHPKTVECHVTEMLRRLGARNTLDAIRIASRARLII